MEEIVVFDYPFTRIEIEIEKLPQVVNIFSQSS